MGLRFVRLASAVLVLALVLAPSASAASVATPRPGAARPLSAGPDAHAPDQFDEGDDTPAGARDLTGLVAGANAPYGFGKPAWEEAHAISAATNESSFGAGDFEWDEDWFRFTVSASDVAMGKPYLMEARPGSLIDATPPSAWLSPVIEVYAPGTPVGKPPYLSMDSEGYGAVDTSAVAGDDFAEWTMGSSASVSFVPTLPGEYYFRVRPYFDGTGAFETPPSPRGFNPGSGAGPYTLRFKAGQVTRLAGSTRVQTAVALSKERYPDGMRSPFDAADPGGTVIVANGFNFPDALAGSTLAAAVGGPLLLTHDYALDADVRAEIVRLGAQRVFVLGGPGAVSDGVVRSLEAIPGLGAGKVVRVAGWGRVQTAAEIARRVKAEAGSTASLAFVADAFNFPDALAASPMAAFNLAPILLTHRDYLDGDTLAAIRELGITDVVILGSTNAVGAKVESSLKTALDGDGKEHVLRLGGADRWETAARIAEWETGGRGASQTAGTPGMAEARLLDALDPKHVAVAWGWNYPDALAVGSFAGGAGYPLLLTPQAYLSKRIFDPQEPSATGVPFFSMYSGAGSVPVGEAGRSYVIGGAPAVADSALVTLDSVMGSTQ